MTEVRLTSAGPRAALLLLGLGALLAGWTWHTWPDPLVDFGRELYAPWRLSNGEILHRDLAWFNGPLSVHANALLFRVFGPGATVLFAINLLVLALTTWLLWRALERMAGSFAATTACAMFLAVFGFSRYGGIGNYNFVAPYSHELTHGFFLGLCTLALLDDLHEGRPVLRGALAGLCAGLCFLTKPEPFLATLLAAGVALLPVGRARRARGIALLAFLLALSLAASIAWGLEARVLGASGGWRSILGAWPHLSNEALRRLPFYLKATGLDDPQRNFMVTLVAAAATTLLFSLPVLAAGLAPPARVQGPVPRVVFGLALGGLLWLVSGAFSFWNLGRALPIFAACLVLVTAWRARLSPSGRGACALAVFSLVLLAKMGLYARFVHYGFVLAAPSACLFVAVVVGWIPDQLSRTGRAGALARAGALGLLAAFVGLHLSHTQSRLRPLNARLGDGADRIRGGNRAKIAQEALTAIRARLAPEETLLVVPEGVMLNYLARRRSPVPYLNFMPPELIMFGEETMLDRLRASPPDWIAVVHKNTAEYGARFFGQHYAQAIGGWISREYVEVERFGAPPLRGRRFGISLRTRRAGAER